MPTQLQLRRGTTAQTAIFTGASAEVTVDTDKNTLVVHDGSTQGGFPLPVSIDVQTATGLAQAAFDAANNAFIQGGQVAFEQANTATAIASDAFNKANSVVQQAFVTVAANGINLVADSNTDILTINSADGVSIFANNITDTLTINLSRTGITSGLYGDATNIPTFTVDNFGRITEVTNVPVATNPDFAFFLALS